MAIEEEPNVGPVLTEEVPVQKEDEEDVGPPEPKKRKAVNANELTLLENLPAADRYEKSYMHRNGLTFAKLQFSSHFSIVTKQSSSCLYNRYQIKFYYYELNRWSC